MSFMQKEITEKMKWYQVDTIEEGITFYPYDEFSKLEISEIHKIPEDQIEVIEGYGARMSAPGYLDCTEWTVFASEKEAEDFLDEYYGEEENESME